MIKIEVHSSVNAFTCSNAQHASSVGAADIGIGLLQTACNLAPDIYFALLHYFNIAPNI